jgi:hypothetical protein
VRESFFSRRLTAASFGSIKRITAGSPSIQQSVPQRTAAAELRSRGHRKRMCSTNAHNVSRAHRISGSAAAVKNKSPRQHEICKAASSQRNNWSLFSIRRSCRRRTIKKMSQLVFFSRQVFTSKFYVRRHVLLRRPDSHFFIQQSMLVFTIKYESLIWLTVNS